VSDRLVADLRAAVGADAVSTDASDLVHYGRDWTRAFAPDPCAVCWPRSAEAVAAVVRACRAHGVAIVPSGGRTGLAGGAVAMRGELVLSLERMRAIDPVDVLNRSVRAEAGVVHQALQDHCRPFGLWWPVDLAAKGSATIGGNLATNAGGVKVLRYGHARRWVLGVEAVTAAGEVLRCGGALHKDNSGYALAQLLVGSEGTLAIVTAATLSLVPLPPPCDVALVACRGLGDVLALFAAAQRVGIALQAFEYLSDLCLQAVAHHIGRAPPVVAAPAYALVEAERGGCDLAGWLADQPTVCDGTVAADPAQAARLWQWRERITESLQPRRPHKNDVAVPVSALPAFATAVEALIDRTRPGWQVALFGHVGDGNLHINTLAPAGIDDAAFGADCAAVDDALYQIVAAHRGSISAEHGIGLAKKRWLGVGRSDADLAALRAVKRALDPTGLLNPGKILDM